MAHIESSQLEVDIAELGDYTGSRFAWGGFIQQVTMKGSGHTFCVPESLSPGQGTGGAGFCNEFGIFKAIGYEEAKVGEGFPKLGVGILTRTDEGKYDFFKPYPVEPFKTEVEYETGLIRYRVLPKECRGYAAMLEKTVSVRDSRLHIDYELVNVGKKRIETHEYVHNFIGIDHRAIGSDYVLRIPQDINLNEADGYTRSLLHVDEHEIGWNTKPDEEFYFKITRFTNPQPPSYWELMHQPSGISVRESGTFPALMMAVWGKGHVVSPEVFVDIQVEPGKTKRWTRIYEFIRS